jgi:hypothetical protein
MLRVALTFGVLMLAVVAPARAEDEPAPAPAAAESSAWEFSLAPYLWMSKLDGSVSARGQSADFDVPFSDIWDNLDMGVLGAFEARKDKFSLTTNLIYMKLSPSGEQPVGSRIPIAPPGSFEVRLTTKMLLFELRPAYEVLSLPLFGADDERRIALDLGPAARIWWLDNHVHAKLEPGVPVGPFSLRVDETTDWVDFLGAARVRAQLFEKIGLVVSGDYGGFDIGSSSHKTWSLSGIATYQLGEHWDLLAGWRTLSIDRNGIDAKMEGPLVGANYRF